MKLSFEKRESIGYNYVAELVEPRTPFGRDALKRARAFEPSQREELRLELRNVELLLSASGEDETAINAALRDMSRMKDVRGTLTACAARALGEVELFELRHFALLLSAVAPKLNGLSFAGGLTGTELPEVSGLLRILDPEGNGLLTFYIEDSRTPELFAARREKRRIDVELAQCDAASRDSLAASRTAAQAREEAEEQRIRGDMSDRIRPMLPMLNGAVAALARFDLALQKAKLARRLGAVKPEITESTLSLTGAFNPRVKAAREQRGGAFMPISIAPPVGVTVITGANMGGKSVSLKTVALNVYLAALGFFVFAEEASVPLFDSMQLVSEDLEAADRGLSSFGGEIVRFGEVCDDIDSGAFTFIILDEFARGTNSREGAAIVRAAVKYLNPKNCVALLATHYDGASALASAHYQTAGLRGMDLSDLPRKAGVEYIEKHMDYGLYPVPKEAECPRDAVTICRLLDMRPEMLAEIVEADDEARPPVVSFTAFSGTGKTTLIEKVVAELTGRGLRVATVKHDAHGFEIDKEGKDSWRFTKAGAVMSLISSDAQTGLVERRGLSFERVLGLIHDVDIVLTEGYSAVGYPVIGLSRAATGKGLRVPPERCVALVTDEKFDVKIPVFALDDAKGVADFVVRLAGV